MINLFQFMPNPILIARFFSEEALDHYCKLKLFYLIYHIRIKCREKIVSYTSVETDKNFQTTLANMIDVLKMSK